MITVSAPGKLMLFGDHAVVYGKPCIATAINKRIYVSIEKNKENITIDSKKIPIGDLNKEPPKELSFILTAIKNFFNKYNIKSGLNIKIRSDFSDKIGFGSSSAITVSTIKALSELFKKELNKEELFNLSYKTILDIQKIGSGFDVAAAIYGGTIFYKEGYIKKLNPKDIPLIVGYTGKKANTTTIVKDVAKKKYKYYLLDEKFDIIEKIVLEARKSIENNDMKTLGELMNFNQGLLNGIGVSSLDLEKMIFAARRAGAYGAKLSGAGIGDCMIAIAKNKKQVEKEIKKNGQIIPIKINEQGVKIEKH